MANNSSLTRSQIAALRELVDAGGEKNLMFTPTATRAFLRRNGLAEQAPGSMECNDLWTYRITDAGREQLCGAEKSE